MQKQKGAVEIVLVVLLVAALGVAGYFYLQSAGTTVFNKANKLSKATSDNVLVDSCETTVNNKEVLDTLKSIKGYLGTTANLVSQKKFEDWIWMNEDKSETVLKGCKMVVGLEVDLSATSPTGDTVYESNYSKVTDQNDITVEFLDQFRKDINTFFMNRNFVISSKNTKSYGLNRTNDQPDFRLGYENQNVKCVITLSESQSGFGSVFCGTIDQKTTDQRIKDRIEFANIIEKFNQGREPLDYSWAVSKREGDYATGHAGAGAWIAVKEDGKWKDIWGGMGDPGCALMEQYKVPQSVYLSCGDY